MTALWIVLGVLLGLILLVCLVCFFGKARVRIRYDRELRVIAYIFGIPFYSIGEDKEPKRKKKNLSRCRNPERALQKELKRQKKAMKKAYRKALNKKKKTAKLALEKKRLRQDAPSLGIKVELEIILELLKTLRDYTKGKIFIRVRRMKIRIATEDAAKTAILYGAVLQSATCILEVIDQYFNPIHRKDGDMEIFPDYLATASEATINIECSMRLVQFLDLLINLQEAHETATARAVRRVRKKELAEQQKTTEKS